MLSTCVIETIQPLIPWMDEGILDTSIHQELSGIKYHRLDKTISFLMDQTPLSDTYQYIDFCTWKIDMETSGFSSQVVSSFTKRLDEWPVVIQESNSDENSIYLEIISPNSLNFWLSLNSKSRYLAIPVSLGDSYEKKSNSGHACMLIFDNALSEVYFFDPNGQTNFFGQSNEIFVDRLFDNYFDIVGSWEYVTRTRFNYYQKCLNRRFSGSLIDNPGNCMITSILFSHYLQMTQFDVSKAINLMGSLEDSDLITIINGYSVGICRLGLDLKN